MGLGAFTSRHNRFSSGAGSLRLAVAAGLAFGAFMALLDLTALAGGLKFNADAAGRRISAGRGRLYCGAALVDRNGAARGGIAPWSRLWGWCQNDANWSHLVLALLGVIPYLQAIGFPLWGKKTLSEEGCRPGRGICFGQRFFISCHGSFPNPDRRKRKKARRPKAPRPSLEPLGAISRGWRRPCSRASAAKAEG